MVQTIDGPFWAEHTYEPCKSGRIDASGWAIYTNDQKTNEKILIGWQICLPRSLHNYATGRLAELRVRLKRTKIRRMSQGDFFSETDVIEDIKIAKAIKNALNEA